jgi:chlorite dismutase
MADLAKEESAKEVENIISNSGIMFRSYSNLGLRDDADFLFWFAAKTVDEIIYFPKTVLYNFSITV